PARLPPVTAKKPTTARMAATTASARDPPPGGLDSVIRPLGCAMGMPSCRCRKGPQRMHKSRRTRTADPSPAEPGAEAVEEGPPSAGPNGIPAPVHDAAVVVVLD